jgi:hypothetical protein
VLAFIVSMRARALSRDWQYHTWLLQRTVDSILAQTDSRFEIAIGCHDIPEIAQASHPKLHMLPVTFRIPERTNDDMCADKVLKLSRGVEWAIERGSDYVMFVDADDLVSRRLAGFVADHHGANGWYFVDGYVHRYGERWVRTHSPHHLICGTGAIVKTSLLRFAPSELCRGAVANTLADAGHGYYRPHLEQQGTPIAELPFPGAICIQHSDSTSEVSGGAGYRLGGTFQPRPSWKRVLGPVKRAALTLPTLRPITPALRAEFTIPPNGFPAP